MLIYLLEPFFAGSHQHWAEGLKENSNHEIEIISLPGRHWKWRMHIGAPALAARVNELAVPDLLLATDMLDVAAFKGLLAPKFAAVPVATYFHENQITYPWSPKDEDPKLKRDLHYGFINFTTALASDHLYFNSLYHRNSFLEALPKFLKKYPDQNSLDSVPLIEAKSSVLHLGMNLRKMLAEDDSNLEPEKRAVILWNHRWEYDKNPMDFFQVLFQLQERGVDFRLIVLGEQYEKSPEVFMEASRILKDKIIHFGYAKSRAEYSTLLAKSDIGFHTSNQDFFGGSVVESMYCNVTPLLPKRLAYPEHIPEAYQRTFFYDDLSDATNRLQRMIFNVKVLRNQSVRQFVEHYDWSEMKTVYDTAFSTLLAQRTTSS